MFVWGPNYIIAFSLKLFNVGSPIIAYEGSVFNLTLLLGNFPKFRAYSNSWIIISTVMKADLDCHWQLIKV